MFRRVRMCLRQSSFVLCYHAPKSLRRSNSKTEQLQPIVQHGNHAVSWLHRCEDCIPERLDKKNEYENFRWSLADDPLLDSETDRASYQVLFKLVDADALERPADALDPSAADESRWNVMCPYRGTWTCTNQVWFQIHRPSEVCASIASSLPPAAIELLEATV